MLSSLRYCPEQICLTDFEVSLTGQQAVRTFIHQGQKHFLGIHMILTTSIRDMSQKGPILSSIEIMTYCSFAKPMLDNFKICKEERGSGETN